MAKTDITRSLDKNNELLTSIDFDFIDFDKEEEEIEMIFDKKMLMSHNKYF